MTCVATSSGVPFWRDAADAGVDAAGVFTHDHEVDVLRPFVLERGLHIGIQLHRPQVDVLIEGEARLEQNAYFQNAGLDVGMADGAQENGIELLELLQCTVRQDLAGALLALARIEPTASRVRFLAKMAT